MPLSVYQDGRVRYWYEGQRVAQSYEVDRCFNEAVKGLKVGPWLPGRLAKAGPANVSTSMVSREVVVPVRVNGILGTMAVRSGADFTFVTTAYANRSGLQIIAESPTIRIRAGDKTVAVPYARARALEVGDASVEALDIAIYDALPDQPAVDGVLGKSFLTHFRMTIDRTRNVLTLEPLRPAAGGAPGPERVEAPVSPPVTAATAHEWRVPVWAAGDEWRVRWGSPTGSGTYVQRVEDEETVDGVVHYVVRSGPRRTYYVKATKSL